MSATAAEPPNHGFGKSLALALAGAAIGCLVVAIASVILGVWVLFLAFPLFILFLVLGALVAALVTTLVARLRTRRLAAGAIIAASAILTFLIFSALPLYFTLFVPGRAGGLLFG